MSQYATTTDAVVSSLDNIWEQFVLFLPLVIAAIIVLVAGILIAWALSSLAKRIIEVIKIDKALEKTWAADRFKEAGLTLSIAGIIAWIVKWFFLIVTLVAVVQVLGWSNVTDFLIKVALYIPNVIIAVIILIAGGLLGQFVQELIVKSLKVGKVAGEGVVAGNIARWAIVIFSILAALSQLGIAEGLINTIVMGVVGMLALALGLAFGLGGRDKAKEVLEKVSDRLKKVN